jgi:beta-lactamase regulating signal transducer with metallopeptidase domain
MHFLTQSALLQALGWSLFNSLWQMGLLWLLYQLYILVFSKTPAHTRHSVLLLLLLAGTGWFMLSFFLTYFTGGIGIAGAFPLRPVRALITSLIPYGSSLYLLIITGLITRYFYFYFSSGRLRRQGLSRVAPEFRVFVSQSARQMGIRQRVSVWLSSKVQVPVTLGFLKPVILLPLTLCNSLTTAQVEAILIHELAHIRRNDFLLNLVVTLLEGLFFFNPFVRRLIADLRKEREHCCDDQVLQFRYDPHSYVSALLALASGNQQKNLAMAATGDCRDQLLLQRARRILLQQRTGDRPGPFALLFVVLLLTGVTLTRQTRAVVPDVSVPPTKAQPVRPRLAVSQPVAAEPAPRHSVFNHTATIPPAGPSGKEPSSVSSSVAIAQPKTEQHPDGTEKVLVINTVAGGDWNAPKELVAIIENGSRDYSIGQHKAEVPVQARAMGLPFVPHASFTFHPIEEDTLRPQEKLARLQMETQREIALSMQKLQLDLMAQLEMIKQRQQELAESYSQEGLENLKQQRALIEQQLRLQKAYIQRLDELQKQLKKARHLTIVYI